MTAGQKNKTERVKKGEDQVPRMAEVWGDRREISKESFTQSLSRQTYY